MVEATKDIPVVWSEHAKDRWTERFGEEPQPEVNIGIVERAMKAGFGMVSIVGADITTVLNLRHKVKAVVVTAYRTGEHEEGWCS